MRIAPAKWLPHTRTRLVEVLARDRPLVAANGKRAQLLLELARWRLYAMR